MDGSGERERELSFVLPLATVTLDRLHAVTCITSMCFGLFSLFLSFFPLMLTLLVWFGYDTGGVVNCIVLLHVSFSPFRFFLFSFRA